MKKLCLFLTAASIAVMGATAFAANDISIRLDGQELYCEQPPVIVNDSTLVPLRVISESMGYDVEWNGEYQMIDIISNYGETVTLYIGSTDMITGGGVKTLLAAPVIINDFTMVPIRAIAEMFGCSVDWDGDTRTVDIWSGYYDDSAAAIGIDEYEFEYFEENSVLYDLDGNGNYDSLSVNVYPVYSEEIGDNCGRYEFIINGVAYHFTDRRHGGYDYVYITDIDRNDPYLDIVLIENYKGKSAEIYRFDGNSIISAENDYGDNYFSVWDSYWDSVNSGGDTDPYVRMWVNDDSSGFGFECGGEIHEYVKVGNFVYNEI